MSDTKLTSVKVIEGLYYRFKISAINSSMTLQKLVNRSIFLYLDNKDFKENIDTESTLSAVSSSKF